MPLFSASLYDSLAEGRYLQRDNGGPEKVRRGLPVVKITVPNFTHTRVCMHTHALLRPVRLSRACWSSSAPCPEAQRELSRNYGVRSDVIRKEWELGAPEEPALPVPGQPQTSLKPVWAPLLATVLGRADFFTSDPGNLASFPNGESPVSREGATLSAPVRHFISARSPFEILKGRFSDTGEDAAQPRQ